MVSPADEGLMRHALNSAWMYQGLCFPNPSVGAVVSTMEGDIVGVGAHQKSGSAHAEVLALKAAYRYLTSDHRIDFLDDATALHTFLAEHHQNIFKTLQLHVTLEPCNHFGKTPPCAQLLVTLGIQRVVVGVRDTSKEAQGGLDSLRHHGIAVEEGCLQQACDQLLYPFTCKQSQRPFVFFKIALSSNGVASGGEISSLASRTHVHALRHCCDLLCIGGNTVRIDRPTLDARLVGGRAPDVLIYSKNTQFDHSIPLFEIENRTVHIAPDTELWKKYSMVMVEGGQGMLDALQEDITWYLVFQSHERKEGTPIRLPSGLQPCFQMTIGTDTMTWYIRHV